MGATLTLLVAVGKNDISVLQGIVQAVSHLSGKAGVTWIVVPFAVMLSFSIAGIGSAWMGGSARAETPGKACYGRRTLLLAGASGLLTTTLGIALAFFPARQVKSLPIYETWMFGGSAFFIGLAAFFFFMYGRRKVQKPAIMHEAIRLNDLSPGHFAKRRCYSKRVEFAAHGTRDMPVWGPVFMRLSKGSQSEVKLRTDNLTDYIKSLQQK